MKAIQSILLAFFCLSLVLAGCADDDIAQIVVERGAYNQPSITVRHAPNGNADELLVEKQGYVEAQDRFLQMDMLRRVSQGRLAELFGASAVDRDTQLIATGLPASSHKSLEKLTARFPESVTLLEAFSRGVNQWIQEQVSSESDLVRTYRRWTNNPSYVPDAWAPVDSVSIGESIAFFLSSNIAQRIVIGKIAASYFPELEKAAELLDLRAIENTFILDADRTQAIPKAAALSSPRSAPLAAPTKKVLKALQNFTVGGRCVERSYPFPPCFQDPSYGSNNWAVSREFAGGKQAFVANDPHLQLSFPNNFIELALDATPAGGKLKVRGVNLPGVPAILIGHNERIAWALTNQPADVDEVYIERLNAAGTHVEFEEKEIAIETIKHIHRVRRVDGSLEERIIPLRWVPHHGPILSDHFSEVKPAIAKLERETKSKIAITYKWTGHAGTTELAAILGVNNAKNFAEFKESLNAYEVGAANIVYADVDGNIGYYSHGNYPLRPHLETSPLLPGVPVFGWLGGEFEWKREWREKVPELHNPVSGRIVTANNDPFGHTATKDFYKRDYFGMGFDIGSRAQRITELLDAKKGNLTLEDMQRIQYDHKDLFALRVTSLLRSVGPKLTLSPSAKSVYDSLLSYDGLALRERRGPVIVDTFVKALAKQHFKPLEAQLAIGEEGETAEALESKKKEASETVDQLINSMLGIKTVYHKLNDLLSVETPEADALKLVAAALEQTANDLVHREDRWGQANKLNFFSPLAGIFPSMTAAPVERNGSFATVDVAGKIHGPNFRMIMVLEEGKPIEGINVIAGGNYSSLHGNQWLGELMLWRDGKYRDLVSFAK